MTDGPGPVVRSTAPGRVNLIGDHTDYNAGRALPLAIQLATRVETRAGDADQLVVRTSIDPGPVTVPTAGGMPPVDELAALPHWARLVAAVARGVGLARGARVDIDGDVPLGAGLSSSASLAVAVALALGADRDPRRLARLVQAAEAEAGSAVGLLDPWVIAGARAGTALLLDFDDLTAATVPIPEDVAILVVDSGERRSIADSPYRRRRQECERAAARLGCPLGRADRPAVGDLVDPVLARRARHVVTECRRVDEVARALVDGDPAAAGELLTASHRSLASDFECSTPTVDALVADVLARPGVWGARMTGGGFGGSVVALCRPGAVRLDRWPGRAWWATAAGGASVRRPG